MAQFVEHCSANTEAMGSNLVEVPRFFFWLHVICKILYCLKKIQLPLRLTSLQATPVGLTEKSLRTRKKEKLIVLELPAKNRRLWTASFTLVDQGLDRGAPGGFRQTNYYKSSPLRNFVVILTFQHRDKRARWKYWNVALMQWLFEISALFVIPFSMFPIWI